MTYTEIYFNTKEKLYSNENIDQVKDKIQRSIDYGRELRLNRKYKRRPEDLSLVEEFKVVEPLSIVYFRTRGDRVDKSIGEDAKRKKSIEFKLLLPDSYYGGDKGCYISIKELTDVDIGQYTKEIDEILGIPIGDRQGEFYNINKAHKEFYSQDGAFYLNFSYVEDYRII